MVPYSHVGGTTKTGRLPKWATMALRIVRYPSSRMLRSSMIVTSGRSPRIQRWYHSGVL